MDHDRLREALEALRDGELGEAERREALEHLKSCEECRSAAQVWERISKAIVAPAGSLQAPSERETERFVARVMDRLEPAQSPARRWEMLGTRWLTPALGFATAAFFLSILRSQPDLAAPADLPFLTDSRSRDLAELVLPPDPARSDGLMALDTEER